MDYDAVQQHDPDDGDEDDTANLPLSPREPPSAASALSSDHNTGDQAKLHHGTKRDARSLGRSTDSRSSQTSQSHDRLEYEDEGSSRTRSPEQGTRAPLHIPKARRPPTTDADSPTFQRPSPFGLPRTVSGGNITLRHPKPDLQVLKGAYTGNIDHLEQTAERLSMTSSIEDAIKELHDEQKRSDSRRSSFLSSQGMTAVTRQFSNASSIVEVNSAARSGGYSPAAFILSPRASFSDINGRGRSTSKFLKPDMEVEGTAHEALPLHSPTAQMFSRTDSIAEQEEDLTTTFPPDDQSQPSSMEKPRKESEGHGSMVSPTEHQGKMFADFDGTHRSLEHDGTPDEQPQQHSHSAVSPGDMPNIADAESGRDSTGPRRSMLTPRPQSYLDPTTGHDMVYYPAPVPMMLKLPQKLSKNPSSMARNQRRAQVLSSIPPVARQSAIWLPDVLDREHEPGGDGECQGQEYLPQHQRVGMGGSRLTQDTSHLPPQLRANTYFDLPGSTQKVELKDQSAVATLDSILDASAHAPVGAFTDHAFAGALGAEVYGKSHRHSRSTTSLLGPELQKRASSFDLLRGRRSNNDLANADEDRRRPSLAGVVPSRIRSPIDNDEEDDSQNKDTTPLRQSELSSSRHVSGEYAVQPPGSGEASDEGQLDDELYHGPPTTLLAELQLRKQRQKQRTQHITKTFPNGIHSTLLEIDSAIQTEQKARKKGRTVLAWEDLTAVRAEATAAEDDDDVPLAILIAKKAEETRPLGLMERREIEDNEPLSRRRARLQGKAPAISRATSMMNLISSATKSSETLGQREPKLKEISIPATRPVSGDFASEMMSQFGGELLSSAAATKVDVTPVKATITQSPGLEDEETLGQRRKRLRAEREARDKEINHQTRPGLGKRRSMADILQAHPSAGAARLVSYQRPLGGLLGMHEQMSRRSSTFLPLSQTGLASDPHQIRHRKSSSGLYSDNFNHNAQTGVAMPPNVGRNDIPRQSPGGGMFPQPSLGVRDGYDSSRAVASYPTNANAGIGMDMMGFNGGRYTYDPNQFQMQLGMMQQQINMTMGMRAGMNTGLMQPIDDQGQIDMVERWRQSVRH